MNKAKSRKKRVLCLLFTVIAVVASLFFVGMFLLFYEPPQSSGGSDIAGDYVIYTEEYGEEMDLFLYQISRDTTTKISDNMPLFGHTLNISGNDVLWQNTENEIFLYEIHTGMTRLISKSGSNPKINGDYVVWSDREVNFKKVFLYQISTSTVRKIAKTKNMWQFKIDGDHVIWSGFAKDTYQIYFYQIHANKTTQIWNSTEPAYDPQISGDHILWKGSENSIYLYQINTDSLLQISNNAWTPCLHKDYVAWDGGKSSEDGEIYLHKISTGSTRIISNNRPPDAFFPVIYGDYVKWTSFANPGTESYIYDIHSGDIVEFPANKPGIYSPQIHEDYFLWSDYSKHYIYKNGSGIIMQLNNGNSAKWILTPDENWEIQPTNDTNLTN